MVSFLQKRLSCFYCGKKSDKIWKAGIQCFTCANCDATNYLDADGEITDPPVSAASTSSPPRNYVQSSFLSRSPSPTPLPGASGAFFCHTCTSNQQFVTQALAEYLPSTKDPRYREYERNLPAYKKQLEARYPQVCADCEPRVQARIKAAGYAARSDYVRRMNDKSKHELVRRSFFTKRRLVGVVAGAAWLTVLVAHLAWNTIGLAPVQEETGGVDVTDDSDGISLSQCLMGAASGRPNTAACTEQATSAIRYVLLWNVLLFWWNPTLLRSRPSPKIGEFYKLQGLLLICRTATWYAIQPGGQLHPDAGTVRATHCVMFMLNLVITIVALNSARPLPQIVRFHKDAEPGTNDFEDVDIQADQRRITASRAVPTSRKFASTLASARGSFPIQGLAQPPSRPATAVRPVSAAMFAPPTPPPETDESVDAMDIDTPEASHSKTRDGVLPSFFRESPRPVRQSLASSSMGFRPPVPLQSSGRQLRSRTVKARPQNQRKDSFASNWDTETIASHLDDDTLTVVADEDSEEGVFSSKGAFIPASARKRKDYQFKQATFHSEEKETGLEGMLGFFGLRDDPLDTGTSDDQIHIASSEAPIGATPGIFGTKQRVLSTPHVAPKLYAPILTAPVFILALSAFSITLPSATWLECMQLASLIWCSAASLVRLADAFDSRRPFWELSTILTFTLEVALGIALAAICVIELRSPSGLPATATGPSDPSSIDSLGMDQDDILPVDYDEHSGSGADSLADVQTPARIFLLWVLGQEIIIFIRTFMTQKTPVTTTTTATATTRK